MKMQFCIVGATRGTGLLITQRLLQAGSSVRVLARNPERAGRLLLGKRADIRHGEVTDARSVRDAIAEDFRAIFFTVAATGGIDGPGLFASETMIRNVTYQGLLNVVRFSACNRFRRTHHSPVGCGRRQVIGHDSHSR